VNARHVWAILTVTFVLACGVPAYSYSVLTHEAIVDTVWEDSIEKLLLKKYPRATPEQLQEAHAYAYGGCVLQDMGYYPMGSHFFTDLTHYVRSGAFVISLLHEARDINEYAFALGALAHYAADNNGHPVGVNRAVPLLYSKLQQRFGDHVSYADNPTAHIKTEFGFDVLQIARGRYLPNSYRSFIGFEVSKPLLERAFKATYSMDINDVFGSLDLSIGTYRKTASTLIPKATRIAWQMKKKDIERDQPGMTSQKFLFQLRRGQYEKAWGTTYKKPGIGSRILAGILRVLPKVGPLRVLDFKTPTPEAEKYFIESFNMTVTRYRELLNAESAGTLKLPDRNFDLGDLTKAGAYRPTDEAYAKLVDHLAKHHFEGLSKEVRADILSFYKNPETAIFTKRKAKDWRKLQAELGELEKTDKP
jgi:hypothetical protein